MKAFSFVRCQVEPVCPPSDLAEVPLCFQDHAWHTYYCSGLVSLGSGAEWRVQQTVLFGPYFVRVLLFAGQGGGWKNSQQTPLYS